MMNRRFGKIISADTIFSLLMLLSGALALLSASLLSVLPDSALSYLAINTATLSSDGLISNIDDVLTSIRNTLPLMSFLGTGAIAIGLVGVYLNSLKAESAVSEKCIPTEKPTPPPPISDTLWAGIYVLIFSVLAAPCLGAALSGDEAWTLKYVQGNWLHILAPSAANNHILSTFLVKATVTAFQESEVVARLPAFIAAIFTIFGCFRLARLSWQNRLVAHLVTLQASTSFGVVFCGTNARGYAIAMACTIGLAITRRNLAEGANKRLYLRFFLLTIAAVLTLPTATVVAGGFLASVAIPALACRIRTRDTLSLLNTFIAASLVAFIVYAWSFPVRVMYMASRGESYDDILGRMFFFFSYWGGPAGTHSGGAAVAVLVTIGFYGLWRRRSPLAIFSFLAVAGSLTVHLRGGYPSFWYSSFGMVLTPFVLGEVWDRLIKFLPAKRGVSVALVALVASLAGMSAVSSARMWSVKSYGAELARVAAALQEEKGSRAALVDPSNSTTYYFRKMNVRYDHFSRFEDIALLLPGSNYDVIVETPSQAGTSLVQQVSEAGRVDIPAELRRGRRVCFFDGWIDAYVVLYPVEWSDGVDCPEEL